MQRKVGLRSLPPAESPTEIAPFGIYGVEHTGAILDLSARLTAPSPMATAVVSGAAAAVWAHMPSQTASQVRARLTRTARVIGTSGYGTRTGWGRLDFLKAARLSSSLRGNVLLATGQVASGATVRLGKTGRTVNTDSNGTYRFGGVPQGTYTVSVTKPGVGIERTTLTLRDGTARSAGFRLKRQGLVSGLVRTAATGRAMPGATVRAQGTNRETVTDRSGSYTLWVYRPACTSSR